MHNSTMIMSPQVPRRDPTDLDSPPSEPIRVTADQNKNICAYTVFKNECDQFNHNVLGFSSLCTDSEFKYINKILKN